MSKEGRHRKILSILDSEGDVEVTDLSNRLKVSEITTRRDLAELEESGFLRRYHGGAVRGSSRAFDRPYESRSTSHESAKTAIAAAAAALVRDGDAIALDMGSTVFQMVERLSTAVGLTIVTASLRTAWEVATSKALQRPFRLIVSGGVVREDELSMTGHSAVEHYRTMRVDVAFIGVSGVNVEAGLTDFNLEDAALKKVLIGSARRVVVLADSSKIGREDFVQIAELSQIDVLVTDEGADPDVIAKISAAGVLVQQAHP